MSAPSEEMRTVGRWNIGETLGKGGYSWVKKGYDRKTGKAVALKFMSKADASWADEQSKQVITEIEALKQVRHKHVMKLYAYNLNAKYPDKQTDEKLDVILLVLEYAPGGELFDILYYTSCLDENIARTYFRQTIYGLEACHNAGIAHRDIKPQNLLLDARFRLKITDFGLSKVFESDADAVMTTSYVGTRGYQAPELLLGRRYTVSCDIFSAGVVLFILLTGYPPFEQAHKGDRWFRPLVLGDHKRFWKAHRGCGVRSVARDLITKMLCFDPEKRATVEKIKNHPWFKGEILDNSQLVRELRLRHRQMEIKRRNDAKKRADLQHSIKRDLPSVVDYDQQAPPMPEDVVRGLTDVYTTCSGFTVLRHFNDFILNQLGVIDFDPENFMIRATLKSQNFPEPVKIEARVYKDTEFGVDLNVVQFRRLEGDSIYYSRLLKVVIDRLAPVLTGIPEDLDDMFEAREQRTDEHMQTIVPEIGYVADPVA